MNGSFATTILLFAISIQVFASEISSTPCKGSALHWDFIGHEQPEYFAEHWEIDSKQWIRSRQVGKQAVGTISGIPDGVLARIVGCDGEHCVTTPAMWMPVYLCRAPTHEEIEKIESEVQFTNYRTGELERYGTYGNQSLETKIIQTNIALALMALHSLAEEAPPMKKPGWVDRETVTLVQTVDFNIYAFYEAHRTGERPDVSGTGFGEAYGLAN